MLEIMSEVIRTWEWSCFESFTMSEELDKETKYKVTTSKKFLSNQPIYSQKESYYPRTIRIVQLL